jgi:outer membrane protein assembly factor BamB
MKSFLTLCLCLLLIPAAAAGGNWPQFRGADSRGLGVGEGLPDRWSATENIEWKADIPGRGWSSPIVWGNRVFLTSAVSLGDLEPPKKGLYFGGNRPKPDVTLQWKVYCLDLETGNVLWDRQIHEGKPGGAIHVKNSYASETPATDGERVYIYFGNLGIFCFDFDGNLVWEKRLDAYKTRFGWGTAASPVLHGDRLYVVNDNSENSYLLALDKKTGDEILRVARDEKSNWSTPYIWENDQRTEIVTPGSGKVRSYDLEGTLLWSLEGMSIITIATPYASNGLLYISSGYVGDKKTRPIYAIRPGASGDISLAEGETANDWIAWCQRLAAPYNPSTLVYEDRLYVLYDRGQLACYNPEDGAVVYDRQKLPKGAGFTTSPWAYDGKVFCLNEDGVTFVVKAGDTFEVLNTNPLDEDDMGMATPAIVDDRLLIRTSARLYSIKN